MIALPLEDKLKRLNMFKIHNGYLTIDLNDSPPQTPQCSGKVILAN